MEVDLPISMLYAAETSCMWNVQLPEQFPPNRCILICHVEFDMCRPHGNIICLIDDRYMWPVTASREMVYVIGFCHIESIYTFQTRGPDATFYDSTLISAILHIP
jgi:hypothetical protein